MELPKDKRFKDFTGQEFGQLSVLSYAGKTSNGKHRWLCKCSCGNETVVSGGNLKNGHTRSCGCYKTTKGGQQLIDLSGMKFGKLTVLEYLGYTKIYATGKRNHKWLCKCDCGNEKAILGDSLRSGQTTSCGCHQKEKVRERLIDLTGKRFGKLVVLGVSEERKSRQLYWLCQCDCGKQKTIAGNNLRSGKSKSCGCKQGNYVHGMWGKPGYKAIYLSDPVKKVRHCVSCAVRDSLTRRQSSKRRGKTFDYLPYTPYELKEHLENLWEPWMNWGNYGGPNDNPEKTWQIDHVIPQSKFPYVSLDDPLFQECWALSNLRPLEKTKNMKKGSGI